VWSIVINPPEMPIDDEARNEAHIANTGVRLYWHKKRNGKPVMHYKISQVKHDEIGQFWNLTQKINFERS